MTGNQTANVLQLSAQKASSVPDKGVAVAAVQAKKRPTKAISNKPSPSVVGKTVQNKVLPDKPEAALPSQALKGQSTAPGSMAQKAADAESSSSSSESEDEKMSTAVKAKTATAVKTSTLKPGKKACNVCHLCDAFMNCIS